MLVNRLRSLVVAVVLVGSVAYLSVAMKAVGESGQRVFGQVPVEPAINSANRATVYLLTPEKVPLPSKGNPVATAPLFLAVYPLASTVPASDLDCQPENCEHVNVLPFPSADYGAGA